MSFVTGTGIVGFADLMRASQLPREPARVGWAEEALLLLDAQAEAQLGDLGRGRWLLTRLMPGGGE